MVVMLMLLIKPKPDVLVEITPVDLGGRLVGVRTLNTATLRDFLFAFCCAEDQCIQRLPLNVQC